jgi:hypothetical protein
MLRLRNKFPNFVKIMRLQIKNYICYERKRYPREIQ